MKRKFKIGDLVEWDEYKKGVRQGEIIGYDCFYRSWHRGIDGIGDVGFLMRMEYRLRQYFYLIVDYYDQKEYVIHEDRLRKTKVKVQFSRYIYK